MAHSTLRRSWRCETSVVATSVAVLRVEPYKHDAPASESTAQLLVSHCSLWNGGYLIARRKQE